MPTVALCAVRLEKIQKEYHIEKTVLTELVKAILSLCAHLASNVAGVKSSRYGSCSEDDDALPAVCFLDSDPLSSSSSMSFFCIS